MFCVQLDWRVGFFECAGVYGSYATHNGLIAVKLLEYGTDPFLFLINGRLLKSTTLNVNKIGALNEKYFFGMLVCNTFDTGNLWARTD